MTVAGAPLRVWAPRATSVTAMVDGAPVLLSEEGGGWFSGPCLAAGQRYGFVIDGGGAVLADPRGRALPDGVHGLSAVDDPAAFAWTDAAWTGTSLGDGIVISETHIGTFSSGDGPRGAGTLDSAIAELDELVALGVDVIELMPVNGFNGDWNWGYDGVAWFTVSAVYGGPEAYRRFVDAAHARGLGVFQDVVYNHLGPSGNVLPSFCPFLRSGLSNTWGESVNLDEDEVRAYILDNVAMWLTEYHVDGLRLDAVHALHDTRSPHLLAEIGALGARIEAERGFPVTLIAESDLNDPIVFRSREDGGYGLDGQWSDDQHHALHVAVTGETSGYYADFAAEGALAKVLSGGFFHDGTWSSFRGRVHGAPIPPETPAHRLVVSDQTHDQIGNRAAGERLSALTSEDRLAVAATVTICSPFTPMLFMGEEWGAATPWQFFTAHPEKELGEIVARGRIEEFARMDWDPGSVPNPQDPDTFFRSRLDRRERTRPTGRRLLRLYRDLLRLRHDSIRPGDVRIGEITAVHHRQGRVTIAMWRDWLLAINLSDREWVLDRSARPALTSRRGLIDGWQRLPAAETAVIGRDEAAVLRLP